MELWLYLLLLQLSLAANISFAVPVESATENEKGQALDYLTKYGYNTCQNTTNMSCSVDLSSILKKFQKFYKLEETGTLDAATKQLMNKPRCGNADVLRASQLNTYLKWSKKSLTWSLRGNPEQLSFAKTESIMQWAFQHWTDHIPVKIKQTCSTCNANIVIDFVRKDHGDMHSFDGPGGTLAHAFFPEDGRIHFDKDETWNDGFVDSQSLYLVAVHEIGHALGFDHQSSTESIMYPQSKAMPSNKVLPSIDRNNAQNVYGHQFPSVLKEGQRINMNEKLKAPDGGYSLLMQSDGNLVIFKHFSSNSNQRIWESATGGRGTSPYHAIIQTDGNFVVYDGSHSAIWATNTQEKTLYTYLVIQDDGNLVLYKGPTSPEPIWATGTQQKSEDETSTKYIVESFKQAFPNDTIVAYKFKSGGAWLCYGTRLLRVNLKDGYWLQIHKLSKSAGNYVTSDEIKSTANSFINKTKGEVDNIKRRDILWNELKNAFPSHYVNIFIFDDNDWTRNGQNTKGSAYFEKNYGSEVSIVLT
ncbi:unnamed protein product [Adineta steineri]|uniref:Bulb-type lectin domain-containing protein n=1 Tax=Adineta steineri TaxID=433720 RepID=A0A815PL30_9BILA|nr:unnamed protein product [Adineta steineri]CAF1450989.1 unnamed protein product [Adineta steineri]